MTTEEISKLIEWIDTELNLVKIQDGFLYHGQYFTNEQIIEIWKRQNTTTIAKERSTK
jgi:hypothetical protein